MIFGENESVKNKVESVNKFPRVFFGRGTIFRIFALQLYFPIMAVCCMF